MIDTKTVINAITNKNERQHASTVGIVSSYGKDAKVVDTGGGVDLIVTANTSDIDLENEVVVPEGADTGYFAKNRAIFLDHRYTAEYAVGTLRNGYPKLVLSEGGRNYWQLRVALNLKTDAGRLVQALAEDGGIGMSIGFDAIEYGPPTDEEIERYAVPGKRFVSIVRKWHWLETSATRMPCNVACQTQQVVYGQKRADLAKMVTKGVVSDGFARTLDPELPKVKSRTIIGPGYTLRVPA